MEKSLHFGNRDAPHFGNPDAPWIIPSRPLPRIVNPLVQIYGDGQNFSAPPFVLPDAPRGLDPPPQTTVGLNHRQKLSEECLEYVMRFYASEGFDVPPFPKGLIPNSDMLPYPDFERLKKFASFAIHDYNEKNATNYSFVSVVKGYARCTNGFKYLITFVAQAADADHGEIFQAKVAGAVGTRPITVQICRPKPT